MYAQKHNNKQWLLINLGVEGFWINFSFHLFSSFGLLVFTILYSAFDNVFALSHFYSSIQFPHIIRPNIIILHWHSFQFVGDLSYVFLLHFTTWTLMTSYSCDWPTPPNTTLTVKTHNPRCATLAHCWLFYLLGRWCWRGDGWGWFVLPDQPFPTSSLSSLAVTATSFSALLQLTSLIFNRCSFGVNILILELH